MNKTNIIRKKIIKEIGKLKPSINENNANEVNFSSIFIVPIAHKLHEIKEVSLFFNNMQKHWELKNNSIEKDLYLYDIKEYIKVNAFESINTENHKELKSFIYDKKNIYLSHKTKGVNFAYKGLNIILKEIDLWIMDGNIAFFVYKIELDINNILDINTISTKINRDFRDYKYLSIDVEKKEIYYRESKGISLLTYLISLTQDENKISFLNISCEQNEEDLSNDLKSIISSTYYAKMITGLHIDEHSVMVDDKEEEISPMLNQLNETAVIDLGILEELSYLLGTTSSYDFDAELSFVGYEGFIYPMIQENGINIWKYWSGIAMQDSVSFFSIDKGTSGIVFNSRTSIYFIYIINLYVNIRLKYFENYLIDKDFINIERVLPSVREIQILKNHYIANEIAIKFQPNYINNKITIGLKSDKLLEEVENNLQTTLELTKNNTDMVFSLGAGVATLGSMWLTNDLLVSIYEKHPYMTILGVIILSIFIVVAVSRKSLILKFVKNNFKIIKRFIGVDLAALLRV